jgi:hypothetical protein
MERKAIDGPGPSGPGPGSQAPGGGPKDQVGGRSPDPAPNFPEHQHPQKPN